MTVKAIWPGQPGGYQPRLAEEVLKDKSSVISQKSTETVARSRKAGRDPASVGSLSKKTPPVRPTLKPRPASQHIVIERTTDEDRAKRARLKAAAI
jgi:hypothetical protein